MHGLRPIYIKHSSMNLALFDLHCLNALHRQWTHDWHAAPCLIQTEQPWAAAEQNHDFNFRLWHEEDIARRDDIPLERIREAKRNIDRFNQARNNAMELMDDWILATLQQMGGGAPPDVALHSETPGMMIDRLSIMALKEYHMAEQAARGDASAEHRVKCAARVAVLKEQQGDLSDALRILLAELSTGRRRFKVYRQFKMYNDPTLNPQLYAAKSVS